MDKSHFFHLGHENSFQYKYVPVPALSEDTSRSELEYSFNPFLSAYNSTTLPFLFKISYKSGSDLDLPLTKYVSMLLVWWALILLQSQIKTYSEDKKVALWMGSLIVTSKLYFHSKMDSMASSLWNAPVTCMQVAFFYSLSYTRQVTGEKTQLKRFSFFLNFLLECERRAIISYR